MLVVVVLQVLPDQLVDDEVLVRESGFRLLLRVSSHIHGEVSSTRTDSSSALKISALILAWISPSVPRAARVSLSASFNSSRLLILS